MMQTRISFAAVKRAANAKAPIVAIPMEGCKVILPRARLVAVLTCPKLKTASIRNGNELKALVLRGDGAAYTLLSVDTNTRYTGWGTASIVETLAKWAAAQRKRRSTPKRGKLERKYAALDKEIRILEKRLGNRWQWNSAAPENPIVKVKPYEDWNREWDERGYLAEIANRKLRPALYLLGRQTWKHWGDLREACAHVGATLPAKLPKNKLTEKPWRLIEVNSLTLIRLCGADAYGREEAEYWHSHEHYLKEREGWLARRRDRKMLEQRITDLRELRAMPEKLAESDIGLPEGVEVES